MNIMTIALFLSVVINSLLLSERIVNYTITLWKIMSYSVKIAVRQAKEEIEEGG